MDTVTLTKRLTVKKEYDVIVCGGGVAGVAAAVTAANRGHSVLLVEKSNILGGLSTLGLVNLFVPMCNGYGKQIIFGLCEKWCRLSAQHGFSAIPDEWKNGEPKEPTTKRYIQRFGPYIFAIQLLQELEQSGAQLLLDCIACDPVMEGNVCKGVVLESKSDTEYYACKMLIDTTGDCDVLRRGGVIIDQAIHSLDLANWFINDEIESVQASLSNRGHDIMEVDDTGEGFVRYKNGATLSFWAMNNYGCDDPIEIRLLCENGKVIMDYDHAQIFFYDGTVLSVETKIDPDVVYEGGKDYWGFQHIREIEDFYNCVEQDKEPPISGCEALKIQKLICEIYRVGRANFTRYSERGDAVCVK